MGKLQGKDKEGCFVRNGGVELFRVICMLMVIHSHIYLSFFSRDFATNDVLWVIFTSFYVTLFSLNNPGFMCISGCYGVKRNTRKLFHYACMIWLYSVIGFFIACLNGFRPSTEAMLKAVFPISTGKYWYATAYFILALLAPGFNLISEFANRKKHFDIAISTLFLFILIPSFLYWGPNGEYTVNFVVMISYYIVLQFLMKYKFIEKINTKLLILISFGCFFLMASLNSVLTFLVGSNMPFGYFAPFSRSCCILMLGFATGLFEIFRRLPLHNKFLNKLSGYVFSVYFLESICRDIMSKFIDVSNIHSHGVIKFILMFLYSLFVFFTCIVVEVCRNKFFFQFEDRVYVFLEKTMIGIRMACKHDDSNKD